MSINDRGWVAGVAFHEKPKCDAYTALMLAADHLQGNPQALDFRQYMWVPKTLNDTGCPLAWVNFFSGRQDQEGHSAWAPVLKVNFERFFARMDKLSGFTPWRGSANWRHNARICARGLRRYARKYHAPSTGVERVTLAKAGTPPNWEALSKPTAAMYEKAKTQPSEIA